MSDQLKNFLMPAADWIIVTLLNSLTTLAMQYVCSMGSVCMQIVVKFTFISGLFAQAHDLVVKDMSRVNVCIYPQVHLGERVSICIRLVCTGT